MAGSDTNDNIASFTVPNRVPTVEIISPSSGVTVVVSQTLALEGRAYRCGHGDDA